MEGEIKKETSSRVPLILDVLEVGSEFIPGALKNERGQRENFICKREQP